jgi:hypothetical protein
MLDLFLFVLILIDVMGVVGAPMKLDLGLPTIVTIKDDVHESEIHNAPI